MEPERFRRRARTIGPNTEALVITILARRPHPEQGFRSCLGILRLYRGIMPARAEAISARAVEIGALNYGSVASILSNIWIEMPRMKAAASRRCSIIPISAVPATTIEETMLLTHPTDRLYASSAWRAWPRASGIWMPTLRRALDHMEWLAILLEHETTLRQQKRFEARARAARLRHSPPWRISITVPPAASTARYSEARRLRLDPHPPNLS